MSILCSSGHQEVERLTLDVDKTREKKKAGKKIILSPPGAILAKVHIFIFFFFQAELFLMDEKVRQFLKSREKDFELLQNGKVIPK